MEVVFGAFADANTNALFAMRKGEGFLSAIPPTLQVKHRSHRLFRE
jgi:hypothetical protein